MSHFYILGAGPSQEVDDAIQLIVQNGHTYVVKDTVTDFFLRALVENHSPFQVLPQIFVRNDQANTVEYVGDTVDLEMSGVLEFGADAYSPSVDGALSRQKLLAERMIDMAAEKKRLEHLTPGDGQQQEYRETLREARLYQDDPAPAEVDYPMLIAERDAQVESGANLSATLGSVASEVLSEATFWNTLGKAIKRERRQGKMLVQAAPDLAAVGQQRSEAIHRIEQIGV